MKLVTLALVLTLVVPLVATLRAQSPTDYGKPRIFIADKDGSQVKLLVEIPEMHTHGSPQWSPDGRLVLLSATSGHRRYELSKIFACAVGGPFNGNIVEMGYGTQPRFSPDMKRIAFSIQDGNPDKIEGGIWIMNDDGSERKRLCSGTRPRWMPDGKSLIFINPTRNLEIIGSDGAGQRPIWNSPPSFIAGGGPSPDGKEVCYIAYPQQPYEGVLYRATVDNPDAQPRELYKGRLGWDPCWSPDGSQIMFWLMDEQFNRHLAVVDAEGKQPPRKLANQEGTRFNSDAEWSPRGDRIIFSSDREVVEKPAAN